MNETIVFCIPGKSFTEKFLKSWTETLIYCFKENINVVVVYQIGADIFQVRNKSFGGQPKFGPNQKPFQNKIKYDYIFCIDSDQTWTIQYFQKMLTTMRNNPDIQALTGVYARVTDDETDYSTIMKILKSEVIDLAYSLLSFNELKDKPQLFKVDGAGLGFCIIRNGVIEKLQYPWFTPIPIRDKKLNIIVQYTAEDLGLWIKLKQVGIDLYCDKTIRVGHEKNRVFKGGDVDV